VGRRASGRLGGLDAAVARLLVAFFCAGALAACALDVSGLSDGGVDEGGIADGSSGTPADGSIDAYPPDDGSQATEAMGARDASNGTVATDGCVASANGSIDCQNPACAPLGYACVAPAPEGWSQAVFDPTGQATCPKQFAQSIAVDVDPVDTPAQCSCGCTVASQPTCDNMAVTASVGDASGCTSPSTKVTADGTCATIVPKVNVPPYVNLVAPMANGGSCSPAAVTQLPPTGGSKGQLCTGGASLAGGCAGGQVCVAAPNPLKSCIEQIGQHSCPAGYQVSHFLGVAHDTRGCGAGCGCTPAASCSVQLTYFNDGMCKTMNASLSSGGCNKTMASQPAGSYLAVVSIANVTCNAAGAPQPVGHVTLDQERTICCK